MERPLTTYSNPWGPVLHLATFFPHKRLLSCWMCRDVVTALCARLCHTARQKALKMIDYD